MGLNAYMILTATVDTVIKIMALTFARTLLATLTILNILIAMALIVFIILNVFQGFATPITQLMFVQILNAQQYSKLTLAQTAMALNAQVIRTATQAIVILIHFYALYQFVLKKLNNYHRYVLGLDALTMSSVFTGFCNRGGYCEDESCSYNSSDAAPL